MIDVDASVDGSPEEIAEDDEEANPARSARCRSG